MIFSNPDQCTVDEMIDKIGFGKFQIKLMIMAGLCWVSFFINLRNHVQMSELSSDKIISLLCRRSLVKV